MVQTIFCWFLYFCICTNKNIQIKTQIDDQPVVDAVTNELLIQPNVVAVRCVHREVGSVGRVLCSFVYACNCKCISGGWLLRQVVTIAGRWLPDVALLGRVCICVTSHLIRHTKNILVAIWNRRCSTLNLFNEHILRWHIYFYELITQYIFSIIVYYYD